MGERVAPAGVPAAASVLAPLLLPGPVFPDASPAAGAALSSSSGCATTRSGRQ